MSPLSNAVHFYRFDASESNYAQSSHQDKDVRAACYYLIDSNHQADNPPLVLVALFTD